MIPDWFHCLSIISLAIAGLCSAVIVADELREPQHMWIMNIVWPATALFGSLFALWAYFSIGRLDTHREHALAKQNGQPPRSQGLPFWIKAGKAASHCGSGCALGDICAEGLMAWAPPVAVWFGYGSLFQDRIFAGWMLDYVFAFVFGVAFQYFTIKPMRDISAGEGILQALKADAVSLTAWQVGMYAFMALAHFGIFRGLLGTPLRAATPEFWFMMQIAMWCGFATSYPVNALLIQHGVKEAM